MTLSRLAPLPSLCLWCGAAIAGELLLYRFYFAHEARFHWFTHFFVGASVALIVMTAISWRTGRPVKLPLVWPLLGHLVAMFPDFLFEAGIAHRRWMDVFLGHLSTHFIPGRNWTWYVAFLVSFAAYLWAITRAPQERGTAGWLHSPAPDHAFEKGAMLDNGLGNRTSRHALDR